MTVRAVLRLCCRSQQATAFGGTLLLPREALIAAARRGINTPERIAGAFNTSLDMARFRYNTTGVQRQLSAGRSR
ncbi:ImmA/IrrE family metallo-endopeptidase [Leifsonia sp. NPDC058230]|uniref:ImmA/IrrE family metallo-endopeptidase n=1 Tax=Leifsonia sp. NPDC058230 TaxID=3346391 RepID=UPI0036D91FFC